MEKPLPPIPAKRYFTIGEVSELCGVKPYVLRYWEQEFAQLRPMKRRGNRRYYQHHEVLLVRRIRELLYDHGFTISGARNRLGLRELGAGDAALSAMECDDAEQRHADAGTAADPAHSQAEEPALVRERPRAQPLPTGPFTRGVVAGSLAGQLAPTGIPQAPGMAAAADRQRSLVHSAAMLPAHSGQPLEAEALHAELCAIRDLLGL